MDKNTLTGLVLIGILLTVFTFLNKPDEKELKEKQKQEQLKSTSSKKNNKITPPKNSSSEESNDEATDDVSPVNQKNKASGNIALNSEKKNNQAKKTKSKGTKSTIENENLIIELNTKGGIISAVYLKKYKSYTDFISNSKKDKLCLFKEGDNISDIVFKDGNNNISTKDLIFNVKKNKDGSSIIFTHEISSNKFIKQVYSLPKKGFEIDYDINIEGFENAQGNTIKYNWACNFRKTERLLEEQRRVSTIGFEYKEDGFDYLSETSDDDTEAEEDINWINYKQSYFSSFLRPTTPISKTGTKMAIRNYAEKDPRYNTHVKSYISSLNIGKIGATNTTLKFKWYFGPNDYDVLSSVDNNYEDILNFGPGLFRWINEYAIQPIFTFLMKNGLSVGISILFLTIILKLFLMPVQWKMFTSSVKMKILKPEIEELNKKYPNKEDAMNKQMAMMNLYRDSGASPLAGCVPMLIQMPILLAVFKFFPASFTLRQKSFLWAEDLSSFDSILDLGFSIPLYGDHVSLFTLLMASSTLFYTIMNSGNMQQPQQPGMPNMKVIMYIFPVMMIFFFNNYSSGLSYYYFISTLSSIAIMLMIKKFFVDEEKLRLKMANRKEKSKTERPKKSKFQQRLEEMQKKQQEQMKNRRRK